MKDTFTKRQVVEILVANNNKVLKLVGDHDKFFVIEGDSVICKRKRMFGMAPQILGEYSFDYVIQEALS